MHCLQFLPRSSAPTLRFLGPNPRTQIPSSGILSVQLHTTVGLVNAYRLMAPVDRRGDHVANANSSSASSTEKGDGSHKVQEEKSEIYSNNMTQAMGAVLTYRHELGMNYNFILPDLIVGSCLQTPGDVDKLRKIGVKTIFCLQQDSDLEYFRVDIRAIQEYANNCGDITHCRAEIRDFDAFDLRMRLPAVVSKLYQAIKQNGGVTYIHCTAGLGRAPAVAKEDTISNNVVLSRNVSIGVIFPQELELCSRRRLVADIIALRNMLAYMFWVRGYKLIEANKLLQSKRACFPKLEAIKSATADILTGISKSHITLIWEGDNCSSVEVSGLDIGWGQRIPLELDREQGLWVLERDLPVGRYEYKYIIDGKWTCNKYELITSPNSDGHVNNYVNVYNHHSTIATRKLQKRLAGADVDLTEEERQMIREFLESFSET